MMSMNDDDQHMIKSNFVLKRLRNTSDKIPISEIMECTVNDDPKAKTTVLLYFPANDSCNLASPKIPPRLRRRLMEPKTTTSQDIETKLRHAHLRRQQFYESLVTKARKKSRSPALQEEDLGERLEAKLYAARQKRLIILTNIRNRLSRMNELRQAAKSGVELRLDKEREDLGARVQSRVQKAEANRLHLLRVRKQRKIAREEGMGTLLMKRISQEKKHKELAWASFHRRRVAAEKKRLGMLEAKKYRLRALVSQVKNKANAVQIKQEIERGRRKKQLEAKYLRAKRLRMEQLSRRAKLRRSVDSSSERVHHGKFLATKLARCWRQFLKDKGTTFSLAKAYTTLGINEAAVKSMEFEQLASQIESSETIKSTKNLLTRLEMRIRIKQEVDHGNGRFVLERIYHLLKRVASPGKKSGRGTEKGGSGKIVPGLTKLPRYPVRVVFCAYMILGHPDAFFSGRGKHEIALAKAAKSFVEEFELLVKVLLGEFVETSPVGSKILFHSQLEKFDKAWCFYLKCFVTWKFHDAKLLEEDLVRAAQRLELNLVPSHEQSSGDSSHIDGCIMAGEDKVLKNRQFVQENLQQMTASVAGPSSQTAEINHLREDGSGFQKTLEGSLSAATHKINTDTRMSEDKIDVPDNEVLVNEIVHRYKRGLFDSFRAATENKENVKTLLREKMEQAFWDGLLESMQQNEPDYSWVLKVMKEVRDELCAMSPSSWTHEINEVIDVDTLSQVLKSGAVDMDYLKRILDFAMVTLQRLSAPASEEELKSMHQKLLNELYEISQAPDFDASFASLMIKGLRVVLQQIQRLKHDVSKARIALLEPLIKGPAGLEYLKNAFGNRYGAPTVSAVSLPLVMQWFSTLVVDYEQDWKDYLDSVSNLSFPGYSPSSLRTGGSLLKEVNLGGPTTVAAGAEQPECKGEKVDLVLRVGLLRLVSDVEGLTVEKLPETLKLNLFRLRDVQSQLQKIIVITSSILVLQQTLLSEKLVTRSADMENMISKCIKDLSELLDSSEDVGVSEVVETMNCFSEGGDDLVISQSGKELMAIMLAKSLRAGDPVFNQVSHTVYLAARAVVLGGSGMKGKQLAEAVLKRTGAALLTEKLVEAVEELVVIADVSARVHRPWYEQLLIHIGKQSLAAAE